MYDLRLGDLLTVWTTYISSTSTVETLVQCTPPAPLMTGIFPEQDAGCHIQAVDQSNSIQSICRIPLGQVNGRSPSGLMTLKTFIDDGGAELPNSRILVCVKGVGREMSCQSSHFLFDSPRNSNE